MGWGSHKRTDTESIFAMKEKVMATILCIHCSITEHDDKIKRTYQNIMTSLRVYTIFWKLHTLDNYTSLQRENVLPKLLHTSLFMVYIWKTVPTFTWAWYALELFTLLLFLEPKFLQCQAFQTKCSSPFQILLVLTFIIWRRSACTATCPSHCSQACNFTVQECIIIRPQHYGELRKSIYC